MIGITGATWRSERLHQQKPQQEFKKHAVYDSVGFANPKFNILFSKGYKNCNILSENTQNCMIV